MRRKAFILILLIPFFLNGCMVVDFINEKVFGVQTSKKYRVNKKLACCNCNSKSINYPTPTVNLKKYRKSKRVIKRRYKKTRYTRKTIKTYKTSTKRYVKNIKKSSKRVAKVTKKVVKKYSKKRIVKKRYISKTKKVTSSKKYIAKSKKYITKKRKKRYAKTKRRYKSKRKTYRKRLAYEPFSINKNSKDPELLGPQTTIKINPLSKL